MGVILVLQTHLEWKTVRKSLVQICLHTCKYINCVVDQFFPSIFKIYSLIKCQLIKHDHSIINLPKLLQELLIHMLFLLIHYELNRVKFKSLFVSENYQVLFYLTDKTSFIVFDFKTSLNGQSIWMKIFNNRFDPVFIVIQ